MIERMPTVKDYVTFSIAIPVWLPGNATKSISTDRNLKFGSIQCPVIAINGILLGADQISVVKEILESISAQKARSSTSFVLKVDIILFFRLSAFGTKAPGRSKWMIFLKLENSMV